MNDNVLSKLNQYLANTALFYIKLHNLHWNVVGSQFKAVHEYLESLYDEQSDNLDEVAEVIRMHGHFPAASLKEYLAIGTIKELESNEISVAEALDIALADIKQMACDAHGVRDAANEEDDFHVANLMEDLIEGYCKQVWFIESMRK